MRRIASHIEDMKDHYQVVVVGSGYGGGISASRMARAGKSVCLLERGREMIPGEYPDTETEALEEMQVDTPEGLVGSRKGLFNFHVNKEQNVLVGCGLGGTSLINANVSLEPKPEVFEDPSWPKAVREHRDTLLQQGFDRAREMLKPNPYPQDAPVLPKLEAHRKSAEYLRQEFYRTPINVTFKDPEGGVNHVGVEQKACNFCGDCVSGCNYQAKNTTLMNYLPDAWNHGAEIFCEASVRYVERKDNAWLVHFQPLSLGRDKFDAPTLFVKADMVVLAAGTLGSTEILLRSREMGLKTSKQLGRNFSGNGDILGFAYNCDQKINGIGFGSHQPKGRQPVGPCITGIIDMRKGDEREKRMIIEEGVVPGAVANLVPATMAAAAATIGKDTDQGFFDTLREKARKLRSFANPYRGATGNMQTYLIMSHDDAKGKMYLEKDRLRIDWPGVGTQPNVVIGNKNLLEITKPLGGTFIKNPIWTKLLRHSLITVHPLGGCIMGEDAGGGVVNHKCQVFSAENGTDVYDSLYVADGAVIPTSLAINPLLTISAVAERACALMAEDRGWNIDYSLPSKPRKPPEPPTLGIRFTETMRGFFSTDFESDDKIETFKAAAKLGKAAGSEMMFTLTIESDDLDTLVDSPQHKAAIFGTLEASALSTSPMSVTGGTFNLFVEVPQEPGTRHMKYEMTAASEEGKTYFFKGYKIVRENPNPLDIWPDTSTLYVTVYMGENDQGTVAGKGILRIRPDDFAKQMTTMQVTNAANTKQRLKALARFGSYFAGVLWDTYGGVLSKPNVFDPTAPPRKKRPLRVGAPQVHFFKTEDDVDLKLTRYKGGTKGPVMLVHGLGVASSIFSTDTIDTNMLEYLFARGYDVWLLDFRASIDLPASREQSNGDQVAKYDYPAAIAKIKAETSAESVQCVVHCWGASTFFMSMLAGLQGVRSIVCSQIATNVVVPTATKIKTGLHLPSFLNELGIDSLTAYVDKNSNWSEKIFNKAYKLYALGEAQGWCNNPVCHRITFMYAPLYRHATINDQLHENLHELFGIANMDAFEHLALLCRKGVLLNAKGEDVYMPHLDRLKLPIRFIHGSKNSCYLPESTERTYNTLRAKFGVSLYSRHVIKDYGHIDCIFGRNAAEDVYPLVLEHLEQTLG